MITLKNIKDILQKYEERYRWLDVFISDVKELTTDQASVQFAEISKGIFQTHVEGRTLQFEIDTPSAVARFELTKTPLTGLALGASLGAILGAGLSEKKTSPNNAIFGLLVGGAVGAIVESAARPQRALTLIYNQEEHHWGIYHGPYTAWAKEALRARP